MRAHLWLMAGALVLLSSSAGHAAPWYSIALNNTGMGGATTPVSLDSSWSFAGGAGTYAYGASLDARPGGVRTITSAGASAYGIYGIAGSISASSSASSSDFVITGPAGATSVTGTFYFFLHGTVELEGGYPANNGHQGGLQFSMRAGGLNWLGQWISGNYSSYGAYSLAGYPGPGVGTVIGLTGSFPVGSGFPVSVSANTWSYPYGNSTYSPMLIRCTASESPLGSTTVAIGNLTGLVMDLPPGYTVASAEWNVQDNHFLAPVLDTPRAPVAVPAGLALLSTNPCAGPSRLRFTLASSGRARVTLFDTSGRVVRTLADGWLAAGDHQAEWDGTRADGRSAPPGVYFASLQAGARTSTLRLVRLK